MGIEILSNFCFVWNEIERTPLGVFKMLDNVLLIPYTLQSTKSTNILCWPNPNPEPNPNPIPNTT